MCNQMGSGAMASVDDIILKVIHNSVLTPGNKLTSIAELNDDENQNKE